MEKEEALLRQVLDTARALNGALASGDLQGLRAALADRDQQERAAADLRVSRQQLRVAIGAALRVPPDKATLGLLLRRCQGSVAETLARYRRRLQELVLQIDELNRRNAAMVRHALGFFERLLCEVTGERTTGRYGSTPAESPTCSSAVFDAEG